MTQPVYPTCGDWPAVGDAAGDAPGETGPTVTLPVTVGDASGDAGPTVTLPETAPGGGGGESAGGGGCSDTDIIISQ